MRRLQRGFWLPALAGKLVYLQRWGAYHLSGHPFCLCKYTFPKALISLSLSSYL